ncbi:unannotated protein [freshwater metagenome]|uniref:Unannotated protein n=1 Tax=freshwater metagenome TaxID=449393 RepID=A0A6J7L1R2_9ZZZZ
MKRSMNSSHSSWNRDRNCSATFGVSSGFSIRRYTLNSGGSNSIGIDSVDGDDGRVMPLSGESAGCRAEENVASSRATRATASWLVGVQKPPCFELQAIGHCPRSSVN